MFDYVRQRPSPTISSLSSRKIHSLTFIFIFLNFFITSLHGIDTQSIDKQSLQKVFQLRSTQFLNQERRKLLRIIYFREFDKSINETYLMAEFKNLTESYGINLKLDIFDQSQNLLINKLCTLISNEQRDTILIADLYTKEIDLISRSLKIPTIAITNRYQIVQGKLHNPYLFKLMPDAVEEAKSAAFTLDTRSVYTRIALIYDTSLDMVEYRFVYLRFAKQHIVYRAQLPRISKEFHFAARTIIQDLIYIDIDLIFCVMSTKRELEFLRLIDEFGSNHTRQLLFSQRNWWFATRLGDPRSLVYHPKKYTASEDRRKTLVQFSVMSVKMLLNAVIRTYIRLPNLSRTSSPFIGSSTCNSPLNTYQLEKTHMFINLLMNFTEWYCDIKIASGVDPILFEPETLAWRVPTIFMVHSEQTCHGMLTRTFYSSNSNADQFFRSCRSSNSSQRKTASPSSPSSSLQQENSTSISSNTIVDLSHYHQLFGKLWGESEDSCHYVRMGNQVQQSIVVGVVEPPYIFVSDAAISSEFHCNYGILCYQIDPPSANATIDALYFKNAKFSPPHCCYGISINLLQQIEDSNLVPELKTIKLYVFSDKPNKWLALTKTLKNRRAHLSISALPYESFLARSVDLSSPFYHSSYVILTAPEPSRPSLGAFLQPFSWTTWCMIFLFLNAAAVFETFFEWHSPYGLTPKGRRRSKVFSLASALTLTWSIIFSHTFKTKSPKCWSNRFLGNVWGGFGIIFIAIYTAKLAAFMVESTNTQAVTNIHGIAEECRKTAGCKIGVVPNTSDEEYLRRFFTNTLYPHIEYVESYTQGIDLLRARSVTHLLIDHSMARYYLTREVFKSIRISGDDFGTFGLSLAFSKFNPDLKNNITNILLSYVDKGIIQRLHDEWYVYENCETKRLNENRMLSVDRFIGVFILLTAGIIVGLITLLLEWLTFKYAVPYWRKRQWPGWMFCSQRLYATLNASDDVFNEAYCSTKSRSSRSVGARLHNYSTRSDSLDLRVVDVPKLLCTTYQLKEQMNQINARPSSPLLPPNGDVYSSNYSKKDNNNEEERQQQTLRIRINKLEQELDHLKSQLSSLTNS